MIVGLGVDIIKSNRVARELTRGEWHQQHGVFAAEEIGYCNAARRPELRYAGCFAAKEATVKALGTNLADLQMLREVEIRFDRGSRRAVLLRDRLQAIANELRVKHIHLSLAMGRKNAAAMVILEF